jgi:putative peptide zinc metalloprotease protein
VPERPSAVGCSQVPSPLEGEGRGERGFPRRAPNVDPIGPADAGGYAEGQWLICVDGSRYLLATSLVYHVLLHADGRTPVEGIARRVAADLGRPVSSDQVRWLLEERLVPAGLVAAEPAGPGVAPGRSPGTAPPPPGPRPSGPLLAIKHRLPLLSYRHTAPLLALLHHLFWPPLAAAILAAAAGVNAWLYLGLNAGAGIRDLLLAPSLVLVLLALDVPLRLFHELGHASAMRRAGATHGEIGVALYVVVPVYYTDVTHAYRLPRRDRIRVDLGGMYFDLISTLVLFALYHLTSQPVFLLAIVLTGLNVLREFTPFMRFDGYYLMADLIGVPEPLSLLLPLALDHIPGARRRPARLAGLTRTARLALGAYFLVVAAFMLRPLLLVALAGPGTLGELLGRGWLLCLQVLAAWQARSVVGLAAGILELLFWTLIPIGLGLFSLGLGRTLVRTTALLVRRARRPAPQPAAGTGAGRPTSAPSAGEVASRWEEVEALRAEVHRLQQRIDAMGREVEGLRLRAAAAERERDTLEACLRRAQATLDRDVGHLQALADDLAERAETARREWRATSVLLGRS